MEEITLEAQLRQEKGRGKVKNLRDEGFLPAVVYSRGKEPSALKVSKSALLKLVHQHRLESAIVNLKLKDDKKPKSMPCLIKEIQYDPVHEEIIHVDFNEVSLTETIKINVSIEAKGEPVGVKQEGGSLEHVLWEVEVECLPTNIPQKIEVDVSSLKMNEAVHIKDIVFPPGVKPLADPNSVVLHVISPMKEEVPAETTEEEVSQEPEVIKEKKEVPEEGAPAEGKEKEKEKEKEEKK